MLKQMIRSTLKAMPIEKVLVNVLERKALELDAETKTNLVMVLASLMPVIQVKDNDTGTVQFLILLHQL